MAFVDSDIKPKLHYRDGLRGWLDEVQRVDELLHVNGAHWDVEMGSITQMLTEQSNNTAPAILFDEIPWISEGFPHPLRPLLDGEARGADARPAARTRA